MKHPLPKFFTLSQKQALFQAAANPRKRAFLSLGLNGALRASEIINLKVTDIDWENARIRFIAKGDKERIVPMNLRLRLDLSLALEHRPAEVQHDFVIWNERDPTKGLTYCAAYVLVRRLGVKAGIQERAHPHRLRHTAAIDYYRTCRDIYQTQRFLGHRRIDTTTRYAQVDDQDIVATINRVNRPNWLIRLLAAFRSFPSEWLLRKSAGSHSFFSGTVGRQKELARLKQNVARGISTIIIGERGVGKSHLIRLTGDGNTP